MQVDSVELCHLSTYGQILDTEQTFVKSYDDLVSAQLRVVKFPLFSHFTYYVCRTFLLITRAYMYKIKTKNSASREKYCKVSGGLLCASRSQQDSDSGSC